MTIKQEQKLELSDKNFTHHEFLESHTSVTGIDVYQFIGNQTNFLVEKTETNKPQVTVATQTDTAMAHEAEKTSTVSKVETSAASDTTSESVTYSSNSYASYTKMAAPQINFSSILPATSDAVMTNGQSETSTDTVASADSSVTDSVDYASFTTLVEPVIIICPIMILPPVEIQITDPIDANASTDTSVNPVDSNLGAPIDANSDTTDSDVIGSDNNNDLPATDSFLTDGQATGDTNGSDVSSVDAVNPVVCPIIDFGYYWPMIETWSGFDIEKPIDSAVDPIPWFWNPETTEVDTDMGSILLSDTADGTPTTDSSSTETDGTIDYVAEPITYPLLDYYPLPLIEPWYSYNEGGVICDGNAYRSDPIVLDKTAVQAPDVTLLGTSDIQLQIF